MSERELALAEDRGARLAAQTLFDRPLVLEAGAGTGKTGILVARVVAWSLGAGWDRARARHAARPLDEDALARDVLERVVAITFTEAAAAEMARRIGAAFAAIAAQRLPESVLNKALPHDVADVAPRARVLLGALDRLRVSTIHAFCRRLLAEQPLEAGLHPTLEVDADEAILEETVERVVDEELAADYGRGETDALALAALGHGPREIAQAVQQLARASVPAAALAEDPFAGDRLAPALTTLRDACLAVRTVVGESFAGATRVNNARRIVTAIDELAALLDGATSPPLRTVQERIGQLLPDNLLVHLRGWAKGEAGTVETGCLGAAADRLPGPAGELREAARFVASLDPESYGRARRVLGRLLALVQEAMRRRGAIPFSGLLATAVDLLAALPEARGRLRRGIDQLLVDEFQDTDRLQCELVRLIALDGPPEERPGLFLVGDPKQSIYGWRNADLRAWDDFVDRVRSGGGERRFLYVNYRSVPAILDEVERCVADVMIEAPGAQPPFRPLLACDPGHEPPGFATDRRRPVEHWIVDGASDDDEEETDELELEAAATAQDVRELHDAHGVAWRTVAVLLRTTTALDVALRALQDAGVPYAVERDRAYFQRREVIDAASLVRAVLDPSDHLALLAVLRSPLVGVPDAALVPLWRHRLPDDLTGLVAPDGVQLEAIDAAITAAAAETATDVPGIERLVEWPAALAAFARTLADLRASFENDPPDRFVERLRSTTLLEAGEAARRLGAFRLANLDRLLRRLAAALAGGGDVQAVLRVLRRSVAEAREAEEARPLEAAEDAVQVMTIHRAKGLTFDHVYLLQTARRSRSGSSESTAAEPAAREWGLRLLGAPNPAWAEVGAHRRQVERAERVRTLYVALTRARARVVISGRSLVEVPVPLLHATTHDALLSHRRATPADLADRLGDAGAFIDDLGVRWRRPARTSAAGVRPAQAEDASVAPERVASDAERLRAATSEAEERTARPWRAPASAEAHEKLAELLAREDEETPRGARMRNAAAAAGSAVHAFLERVDLAAPDLAAEVERRRREARATLDRVAAPGDLERAVERFEQILDRMLVGAIWSRLKALAAHVVARELAVLLPAADDGGPVGYVAGLVDLVYRDPETGELVIADYKTDDAEVGPRLDELTAGHALQGRVYVRAVQDALALAAPPRFELWYLHADVVVTPLMPT
jgi:ATP-dependent exoDNAse (exonuclease V) beta subunit